MIYTVEQLNSDMHKQVDSLAELRKNKGADYANQEDTFSDLRSPFLGERYCLMRIIQKCMRAINLLDKEPACKDEKLGAEFGDIINFAHYAPILYEQGKE